MHTNLRFVSTYKSYICMQYQVFRKQSLIYPTQKRIALLDIKSNKTDTEKKGYKKNKKKFMYAIIRKLTLSI